MSVRPTFAALGILLVPSPAPAQRVTLAVFAMGSHYREQAAALAFGGRGISGRLDLAAGRFGLTATASRLSFSRAEGAAPDVEPFDLDDLDLAGRVRLASIVSVEAGAFRRWISPDRAAQSVRAARAGLRADYRLAPGADAGLRASVLGGARFSGGGSAKAGFSLGFGLSYGARVRGVRLTADYEFLRLNRETALDGAPVAVPIQSSTARLGLALVL
jgi:hypothetical protein